MTLIVGYIISGTVQVIADSALTTIGQKEETSTSGITSFGEITNETDGRIVEEKVNKIYTIENSIICTFSGNDTSGNKILEDIKIQYGYFENDSIENFLRNFFTENEPKELEFIFGFYENNKPCLFHFNSTGVYCKYDDFDFIVMGSGGRDALLTTPVLNTCYRLYEDKDPPDYCLISCIAVLECTAINLGTFRRDGVGGFFNGAFVNEDGITWAKDTTTYLYSNKNMAVSEKFMVDRINRDNVVITLSPKNGSCVYAPAPFWIKNGLEKWLIDWSNGKGVLNLKFNREYYVFIGFDRLTVTILPANRTNIVELIGELKRDDGSYLIGMSKELSDNLLKYAVNPETGKEDANGIGFVCNLM